MVMVAQRRECAYATELCALKCVVNFVFCILYHNLKKKESLQGLAIS